MKNKVITILSMVFVIFTLISNINIVQANTTSVNGGSGSSSESSLSDVISGGDSFIQAGKNGSAQIDKGSLKNASSSIYNILLICGVIIAVLIGSIMGIKFMIGSVEEKAEYKKSFVPLIVGIVLVVAATAIASFIFNMAE